MALKPGNVVQSKTGTIARTNTSNTILFTLPANAMIIRTTAIGPVSDAGTTAVVGVYNIPMGSTSAATVSLADVKANAQAAGVVQGIALNRQAVPQQIYGIYSESGGAASTGGPWSVIVEYL